MSLNRETAIRFGSPKAQALFLKENQAFVEECFEIFKLVQKTFARTLAPPDAEDFKKIEHLPEESEPVKEYITRVMAERIVFYLGRIAADDFSELLTLAVNGYGFGALKILRTMYEHVVTAAFIAKYPSEGRTFAEDSPLKRHKIWKRTVEVMPDIVDRYTSRQLDWLDRTYKEALSRRKSSICNKCGQPITQEAWTRVDLAQMAERTDPNLAVLYAGCYLEPVCHSHATSFGLELHLIETEETVTYRPESTEEARRAILLAHNLILRVLTLQNDYFHLGLEGEISVRARKFTEIWGKAASESA